MDAQWSLKDVYWRGQSCKIITQNENGPCSLIALCNILLLRGDVTITPPDRPVVSYPYLSELIADYLLTRAPESAESGALEAALSTLPRTQYGLNVDVDFTSHRSFCTPQSMQRGAVADGAGELALFELCKVPLVHGWLPDPADTQSFKAVTSAGSYNTATDIVVRANEAARGAVVGDRGVGALAASLSIATLDPGKGVDTSSTSYTPEQSQLIRQALILQDFLDSNSTQLTYHGLFVLAQELEAGQPVALFRNSHVSVLYKRLPDQGTPSAMLYTLVTDSAFLMEDEIVWESLVDIDGASSELFDGKLHKATLRQGDYVGRTTADPGYNSGGIGQPQNEDADFALAMQIYQNDTDRAERQEQRRRTRETSNGASRNQHEFIPPTLDRRTPIEVFTTMRYEPDPDLLLASKPYMTHPDALILSLIPANLRDGHPPTADLLNGPASVLQHRLYAHVPLLAQHLDRLSSSANAMCAAYPEDWSMSAIQQRKALAHDTMFDAVEDALAHEVGSSGSIEQVKGIRVAVSQAGRIRVTIRTVVGFPSTVEATELAGRAPLPTVRFDTQPTQVRALHLEPVVYNKTDARSLYEVAKYRAGADSTVLSGVRPEDGRCFDVLLWNDETTPANTQPQRYLTESSLANVIVEYVGEPRSRFVTPKADIGALDGLLRHWLVQNDMVEEGNVTIDQLQPMLDQGTAKLWLCNALRGVWQVELVRHLPQRAPAPQRNRFTLPSSNRPQQSANTPAAAKTSKKSKGKKDCLIM